MSSKWLTRLLCVRRTSSPVVQYEGQDPDIKDREGTQPARYHKGLEKSTKVKRDAHFKAKKAGPAPGDATAKTEPSKYTKSFKDMYDEGFMDTVKSKTINKKQYQHALLTLKKLLTRKSDENNLTHSTQYYAQKVAKSYSGMNTKALHSMLGKWKP